MTVDTYWRAPETVTRPRESMRGLWRVTQPFLTWVTGVPLDGDRPRVKWRPVLASLAGVVQTAVGLAVGAVFFLFPGLWTAPLLAVSWLTTAGGMRRLDVVVVHQTLHRMFARTAWGNRVVGELVTTLLWRAPYDPNRKEHLLHHAFPCSLKDGDTLYLSGTGARPGMTTEEFNRYLWRATVSPRHHWNFFWGRLKSNYTPRQRPYRFAMSLVYLAGIVAALAATGLVVPWLVLWVIPVSLFFQAHTFLYTLSEHRWWLFDNAEGLVKAQRDQLTFGRFCGEPTPGPGAGARPWARWWLRMLFVYSPYRMLVLVGDTVQHDLHHVRPRCDWANSSYVRNQDVMDGSDRYYEVWGSLLDHVRAANAVRDTDVRRSERVQAR